ncbi:MAG: hypothetical protein AMJ42_00235 [Deltaproteobacteria bacterium DG_8]|nr:MAG: hypothetical protein AMJ42_00235 [Deltaproteobacteria bacterium DG_8]
MPKRRRIIRKKIKEPDEFMSTSGLIIGYVKNNYRNIIPIALLVLIISFLTYGWIYYNREKEKEASHLFYQLKQFYQTSRYNQTNNQPVERSYYLAIGKFEDIIKKYSGTSSAIKALFYIGDCYYHSRDYDKAIDYYKQFINRSRKGDYLVCFAFEGLGYCYEEKEDYQQALEYFKKSMEESEIDIEELQYLNIARCYEALNDKANALQFYKRIIDNQGNSIFSELAQDKVRALKN